MILSNKISHSIVRSLSKNRKIDPEFADAHQYCIEQFLDLLLFHISLLLLGAFLHRFTLTLVYIVSLTPVKMLAGGAHANSRGLCSFLSYSIFLGAIFFCPYLPFSNRSILIMLLPIEILILYFAPVNHPNKVFTKEQSKRMKLALLNYLGGLTIIMGVLAAINESDSLKMIILCLLIILFNQLAGMLIYHNTSHLHPKKRRT